MSDSNVVTEETALHVSWEFSEHFAIESVARGVPTPSKATCEALGNSVWVEVDGKAECIRYWSSGLTEDTPLAVFYIHGDRRWLDQTTSYSDNTASAQRQQAAAAAQSIGTAFVKIARPGLYGSSGAHTERRQMREMKLIAEAVRRIITRHGIKRYGFTGQSGGGSVAAYLLTQFPGAECVTFTAACLSLDGLKRAGQSEGYDYGAQGIYDPIKHLSEVDVDTRRQLYIVADEDDEYALLPNMIEYYEAAKAAGHSITLIRAEGNGHHGLDTTGQHVVAWHLHGAPVSQIEKRIAEKAVVY